ncbi:MAG TPA: NAD(P)(+) transhydrogenase (Re/Si-specific) subunit beta [Candidatus Stackebrandtia faecavium]|nr:NAD(P)(+) transhydrogenase (Re/Si-specific) subunit beta [Candidatus Stackebrandtia faecavium]
MSPLELVIRYVFLAAAACLVLGLHLMNSPATARRGNLLSATAMAVAIVSTGILLVEDGAIDATGWIVLLCGAATGSAVGLYLARSVAMTAMPQLVSIFNAVGGGAAVLLAVEHLQLSADASPVGAAVTVPGALDIVIGAVTFTGSIIAAAKLQGIISGSPIVFPGARVLNAVLGLVFVGGSVWLVAQPGSVLALTVLLVAALIFGVTMVLPIGGADMPVVISLLNAFTGTAVAMSGFVLGETILIVAGALVGAAGTILTKLMADAMNRSLLNIIVGGFGTADAPDAADTSGADVRSVNVDDVAIQLAYARNVVVVPGYGLAAAQAQHELAGLAELLEEHGVSINYAIHPVAGRMPGHMNVLLAESNVPYPQLREMDDINPEFPQVDVALVIGANDVTNPAARRAGNAISGMPILDVDKARSIVVIKRSMGHGYAGIDNELYTNPRTGMLFTDAKKGLIDLSAAVRSFVS